MRGLDGRRTQRGAALAVALMILVITSIIGITAMRTSIMSTKITVGAQAAAMSFHAAETAINAVFEEGATPGAPIFTELMQRYGIGDTTPEDRCVTAATIYVDGLCPGGSFMDSRGLVRAESRTVLAGVGGMAGTIGQISTSGNAGNISVAYNFLTVGHGSLPVVNIDNWNVQEFRTTAFKPAGEL